MLLLTCLIIVLISCTESASQADSGGSSDKFIKTNGTELQGYLDKYELVYVFIYVNEENDVPDILRAIRNASAIFHQRLMTHQASDIIPFVQLLIPISYHDPLVTKYDIQNSKAIWAMMDNGERNIEYTNKLTDVEKILRFLWQKIQDPVTIIEDYGKLKLALENNECSSVGFFQNFTMNEYDEYKVAADWYFECDHYATTNVEIFNKFRVSKLLPTVKFFKGCIHEKYDYPLKLQMENIAILKFFLVSHEADVQPFGMNWLMRKFFKEPQFTLVLFVKTNDENKEDMLNILEKYARRYREEINVVYVEVGNTVEDILSMMYTFDIKESDCPTLRAIELNRRYANNTRKYIPKAGSGRLSITDTLVNQFIGHVYYRQLEPYLVSEPLPIDWNQSSILRLVGDNFRNVTETPDKTVVIVIHDGEPRFQRIVNEIFPKLIQEYRSQGRNDVIFAQSTSIKNEYYSWHPDKFPALILYSKGEKKNGILFKRRYEFDDIKQFIESDGQINNEPDDDEKIFKSMNDSGNANENENSDNTDPDEGEVVEVEDNSNSDSQTKTEL